MKFNFTKHVDLPLEPHKFLGIFEKHVNDDQTFDFQAPLFGRYKCKVHNDKRFTLKPTFRGVEIEGFIRNTPESTTLQLRLMPPVWVIVLFIWAPVLIFVQLPDISEAIGIGIFWLTFGHVILLADILIAKKLFGEIDKIFELIGAIPTTPEKKGLGYFFKKCALYLAIAILYISALAAMAFC